MPNKVDMADDTVTNSLPKLTRAQQAQLNALEKELRCLVCQNQTLAESNANLAGDLRGVVHRQVAAGQTDAQVKAYLVARYGDFVLYKPPVKTTTALLWAGPFGLLAAGAAAWFIIGRRQSRHATTNANNSSHSQAASEQQRQAAAELLDIKR